MRHTPVVPVILLFKGESRRTVLNLARVPCVGEFVHVKHPAAGDEPFLSKVLGVTHLAWNAEWPEAWAEIHCVRVEDLAADEVFSSRS